MNIQYLFQHGVWSNLTPDNYHGTLTLDKIGGFVDVSPFPTVYFQVSCWFSGVYNLKSSSLVQVGDIWNTFGEFESEGWPFTERRWISISPEKQTSRQHNEEIIVWIWRYVAMIFNTMSATRSLHQKKRWTFTVIPLINQTLKDWLTAFHHWFFWYFFHVNCSTASWANPPPQLRLGQWREIFQETDLTDLERQVGTFQTVYFFNAPTNSRSIWYYWWLKSCISW